MLIQKPCVVALTWRLSDAQNQAIDELVDPVEFYYGGDDLLPKVEEAMAGQAVGFEAHLHLEPDQLAPVRGEGRVALDRLHDDGLP